MTPNLYEVSKRIKYIRKNLSMTMEVFGSHIGNSPKSTIATWESGRNLPSQKKLEQIAILGGTSIDWIKWGSLEEYINSFLISLHYLTFINDYPETIYEIHKNLQRISSDSFSLQDNYELLNPFIKREFMSIYRPIFNQYVYNLISNEITLWSDKDHSISKKIFINRFKIRFNEKIESSDLKYGDSKEIINLGTNLLIEMDEAYKIKLKYASIEDFFYQTTLTQFETEKLLLDLSKRYNFPYKKNSSVSKFLINNHSKFK